MGDAQLYARLTSSEIDDRIKSHYRLILIRSATVIAAIIGLYVFSLVSAFGGTAKNISVILMIIGGAGVHAAWTEIRLLELVKGLKDNYEKSA